MKTLLKILSLSLLVGFTFAKSEETRDIVIYGGTSAGIVAGIQTGVESSDCRE